MKKVKNESLVAVRERERERERESYSLLKSKKGITLVALVITIIILLILAGITIAQLAGSGLFENAKLAEQKSKEAQEKEDEMLADYENKIEQYVEGTREQVMVDKEEYESMKSDIETLKQQVNVLNERTTYPVLYENSEGWNSGTIVVEGIEEYEEIGVYISIYDNDTEKGSLLVRCQKTEDKVFSGGNVRYQSSMLQVAGVCFSVTNNQLAYLGCGKEGMTSERNIIVRENSKIYKIVGITKNSQILD